MKLVLGIMPSLAFWRSVYPQGRAPGPALQSLELTNCVTHRDDVLRLAPKWATPAFVQATCGTLDVLTQDASKRHRTDAHLVTAIGGSIPKGSFYRLSDSVYICSPGFVFLRAARDLAFGQLIALGYELCGLYTFDPFSERGMRDRKMPLITLEQLGHYLDGAKNAHGRRAAQRALQFIAERSASPKETECSLLACLPYRWGGYGLRPFTMNHGIDLNENAARIARKRRCYGDLCYPEERIVLEFQGFRDHAEGERFDADRARVNALREMNYEVIELTKGQVSDLRTFELIVQHVARVTGQRIEKRYLGPLPARVKLRRELSEWSAAGGWWP